MVQMAGSIFFILSACFLYFLILRYLEPFICYY
nr:MAG TPA: hypothetical protein [Caudoviricetes sp.]